MKGYVTSVPFTLYIMPGFQQKSKRYTKELNSFKRQKSKRTKRYGREFDIIRGGFKLSMINMLRELMETAEDNMKENTGYVSRELET